ncbi:uncharacterized protein N7458_005946 [Penicillium daleae]|uniref:Uncharacterized protein n=1 Tax=Penicillium daleae TaxID=63821 RepID=A0AAD6C4L1_9EURO|nr:uncharacterized protein N7458_005946 [Penicillium daleae]KAJ5449497.1 hypothetical protein N7458_005946 [Penicillium daleae]
MASNNRQPERPPTYFFPATPKLADTLGTHAPRSNPPQQVKRADDGDGSTVPSVLRRSYRWGSGNKRTRSFEVPVLNEDPWADYEKSISIFPKRHTFLARHRQNKEELVHIEQLERNVATESVHDTICRLSHPSFLRLLCCYHYEGSAFLVWEPVELSLAQVIGSKYAIREAELVSIVWPVSFEFPLSCLETLVLLAPQLTTFQIIQGIRYLRDSNRALASLTYESIFLTDSGSVRITGVERSCEIHAADMNADTLKLFALSDIINGLRKQMSPLEPWSPQAEELATRLMTTPLDDVWRDDLFTQMKGGELKMLVNVVSKISHYDVKFF